ncbi:MULTISPECIES: TRAP transporter substrate-binding protein [Halocynthiibacter]|uniref:TRAP transporter substrate-binding protein n=1 Tax=Halocynthiibacter halioticoli TaxID=2986804 RepID=A0AAE3LSS2_9RHOB|nr:MULTISPECIES: TRAP transporter substrate-binding protein [Halocynthiibacter]MCV6825884.1 TRAP transporter substrate-binding protein [Halocynthiibacter halioticoli]MCW4058885.1 TRAP transporter substrate-binding protein [Halocynthiibacter sp. SDUM655004]MDE0588396.1 TRAP transporter substrate-binding protein [Halocynthiibacter sp. C4]
MIRILKSATFAFAVSALSLSSAAAQEVTLRFQHFVSPKSANPTYFMQPWADKIERDSGGRIKVELYPFMQLGGKAPSQYDLIKDGVVDGGWVIPGYQPGRFPEAEAMEMPFMVPKNGEEASKAAWIFTQKHLMDDFADVHLITAHMHGPGIVHKKGAPISTIEDFSGVKLRGPSRAATLLLKKLGAEPIGMAVPAFPEALSKGVVDGGVITWEMSPSLKLDELTDSHTDVYGSKSLYNLYFIWAMNKDVYAGLPDDLKAVIDANSGFAAAALAGRAHDTGDLEGRELMAEAGNDIAQLSEDETNKIKALGDEVINEWIEEVTGKGLDGAALISDARAAVQVTEGTAAPIK